MKSVLVFVFVGIAACSAYWWPSEGPTKESVDTIGPDLAGAIKRLLEGAKRSGTESEYDDKKCGLDTPGKVPKTHTACRQPAHNMTESRPVDTKTMKDNIVRWHNEARRNVDPPATNMMEMEYDDELAMIAQKWAERCYYKHDWAMSIPDKYGVGQNMARFYGGLKGSWKEVIDAFIEEKNRWWYHGYSKRMKTGHYTQMIWADTTKVGCGAAVCKFPEDEARHGVREWYFYVCDYAPIGNTQWQKPYKKGPSCSECKECDDKLCVCKNDASKKQTNICHNGGTMNPKTCSCNCERRMESGYMCTECVDRKTTIYGSHCDNPRMFNNMCQYWDVRMHCCATCIKSPHKPH